MEEKTKSGSVDYNLPFDSKVQRLKKDTKDYQE